MTLRVEDLKPGDIVRMDLIFVQVDPDGDAVLDMPAGGYRTYADDECLRTGNAERVQRPRPVRKGDEISSHGIAYEFVAYLASKAMPVVAFKASTGFVDSYTVHGWTHANGDPISWEDSE